MVRRSRSKALATWLIMVPALITLTACKEQATAVPAATPPAAAENLPPEFRPVTDPAAAHAAAQGLAESAGAAGAAAVRQVAGAAGIVGSWLWYAGSSVANAVGQGAQASVDHVYSAGSVAGNAAWSGGAAVVGAVGQGAQTSMDALDAARSAAKQLAWEISFALGINPPDTSLLLNDKSLTGQNEPGQDEPGQNNDPVAPIPAQAAVAAVTAPEPARIAETAKPPEPAVAPVAIPAPVPAAVPSVAEGGSAAKQATTNQATTAGASVNDATILAPLLVDMPRREADGTFFIPKAIQRLLDIRTRKVAAGDHPVRIKLPARVIPDPNAEGHVEASVMGRLETAEKGLPILGQKVAKGEVLAYVSPAIGVVDRTQIRRDVARLTTEIRAAAENLEILQKFSFVPFREGKMVQARMHLDGLRRERAALLPLLDTREALRAPTDGVVSSIEVVTGQVLQPGQIAFQIVNPGHLWIEASAADPGVAAEAAVAQAADAVTPEGEMLAIRFAGTGLSMQQQSALLNYAIENPPEGLRVGRPVTVFATRHNQHHNGVAVPHEGVVNGPSGMDEVWEQLDPEHFVPRPVHAEDLDGHTVLVINGLNDGAQVVVHSARLLAQYQ